MARVRLDHGALVCLLCWLMATRGVRSYGSHWWHPDSYNHDHDRNHVQNQIGPYREPNQQQRVDYAPESRTPKDIMADVINDVGLALLDAHNEYNDNNIAISPYGATSVLIALLEGLVGEAAYEIKIATQLPPDLSVVRIGLRDIHRHLKSYFIPKEGFLAGLTLSHDNVTLNREYQSILKFYGYDIESFNSPPYPDMDASTSNRPAVTMTTGKAMPTTTPATLPTTANADATTTEAAETATVVKKLTSTVSVQGKESSDEDDTETSTKTVTMTSTTRGTTKEPRITTEMPTTTTDLPSPNDEDVEDTTTKTLPTRSYTTETNDVAGVEGRTETYYPMTTDRSPESPMESQTESARDEITSNDSDVITDSTTLTSNAKEELRSTPNGLETLDSSAIRLPVTSNGVTATSSFKTSSGTFFKATTNTPSFSPKVPSIPTTWTETTFEGSTLKYETTSFDGSTVLATDTAAKEEIITTTERSSQTTELSSTNRPEEVVTLPERDNELFSEYGQKLTDTTTAKMPIDQITFTTTEPVGAYTQTQNTEAQSLEDQVLGKLATGNDSSSFNSAVTSPNVAEGPAKNRVKRSVIDYLVARYYDNYHINNNRRYIPSTPKTHYANYQPEEPYTFLVNGQHKETNISFMTYDTILPFRYVRSLDAMALSFPLDSDMYYLLLVLPVDPHGIDKLVYGMRKVAGLRRIVDDLQYTHVKAVIPSFMLKGYVVLTPSLQKLGIRKIFEPRHANFAPMTPERSLYVTNIEQAVTVTIRNYVDPASHSARNLNDYRPVEFRADHPFLYFVMDSQTHVTLMAGKIINPLNSRVR